MKALIAEDEKVTRTILERLLTRWGFETVVVEDGLAVLEALKEEDPPRLVLLDWMMPKMDGLEACRRLREQETSDPPYVIFLTAKESPGDMVRALDAGASDCVRKPFDRDELLARIRVGQRTLKLQAELNEARREMMHWALYDSLTGVFNRRAIGDRLKQELARVRRTGGSLSIGLADLDDFKRINDTYGHAAGDAVLVAFVKAVQETIRASDVVGRWGGEEFLILAPEEKPMPLNPVYERLRRHVERLEAVEAGRRIRFTVSLGVAIAAPGESSHDLLHRADMALYRAKATGKNRVCLAPPPDPSENEGDASSALNTR